MARRAEISRTKDHNCTRGSTGEGAAAAEWWDCAGPAAALTGFVADGDCIMVLQPGEDQDEKKEEPTIYSYTKGVLTI